MCMISQDLDLSVSLLRFRVQVFPYLSFSFVNRLFGTWRISGPSFVFSSLPPFLIGLSTLFGMPWARGGVLARDLAWWLTAPIGLACPHQPRLPPPALPAPNVEE
jgi:hypothetical protein